MFQFQFLFQCSPSLETRNRTSVLVTISTERPVCISTLSSRWVTPFTLPLIEKKYFLIKIILSDHHRALESRGCHRAQGRGRHAYHEVKHQFKVPVFFLQSKKPSSTVLYLTLPAREHVFVRFTLVARDLCQFLTQHYDNISFPRIIMHTNMHLSLFSLASKNRLLYIKLLDKKPIFMYSFVCLTHSQLKIYLFESVFIFIAFISERFPSSAVSFKTYHFFEVII